MAGLQERLRRCFLGEPQQPPIKRLRPPSGLPGGSSLADQVRLAVEAALAQQEESRRQTIAEQQRVVAEQERIEREKKEQIHRHEEEIKIALQNGFCTLGVSETLRDVQQNIWKAGEVTSQQLCRISVDSGDIWVDLVFEYPTATTGAYTVHTGLYSSDTRYSPSIYMMSTFFRIALNAKREDDQIILRYGETIVTPDEDGKTLFQQLLQQDIVEDTRQRFLNGELPLSKLVAKGQMQISEAVYIARKHHEPIEDKTNTGNIVKKWG
ncbi:MAG: hypothetical protein HYU80_03380 [Candidatus Blackburnbacteria bacterium]|nr:hypothetical protein [Candidatus Blackburnbacteria bacterium]